MEKKLTAGWIINVITGLLFAAYAAYHVFILIRDSGSLPLLANVISVVVVLLFGALAVFVWTARVMDIRVLMIRETVFNVVILTVFALKLRMIGGVLTYFDIFKPQTVLYCGAYFMTQAALLILFIDFAFILKNYPLYPKAASRLPVFAMVLFLCSFILEAVLFFVFKIGLEPSLLRTVVVRPIFYLGFIGLSVYFRILPNYLLPPPIMTEDDLEDDFVLSQDDEYEE